MAEKVLDLNAIAKERSKRKDIVMEEKKYEVIDSLNHVIATDMNLRTALLLMKAYCEEYYMERANVTLREMEATCGKNCEDINM